MLLPKTTLPWTFTFFVSLLAVVQTTTGYLSSFHHHHRHHTPSLLASSNHDDRWPRGNGRVSRQIPTTTLWSTSSEQQNVDVLEEENNDTTKEATTVSDAEALLACWEHLRRRKQIGRWTEGDFRKLQREQNAGRFWPEEDLEKNSDIIPDDILLDNPDRKEQQAVLPPPPAHQEEDSESSPWSGVFTSFSTTPSASTVKRSKSAKKVWTDPDFRKRWYKARWGNVAAKETRRQARKEKVLKARVQSLEGFLGSPELAGMSPEEIQEAIEVYMNSRKKRIESRLRTLQARKEQWSEHHPMEEYFDGEKYARDALLQKSEAARLEKRRKRMESSRKGYLTRLANLEKKNGKPAPVIKKSQPRPGGNSTQDALLRIEDDLDCNVTPDIEDVRIVVAPTRLTKRRPILKRLLAERFGMRGRVIPLDIEKYKKEPEECELEFFTQAKMSWIGDFILYTMESVTEEEGEEEGKSRADD